MSTEKLIALVQERPWLYDPSHRDYKDNIKTSNAWEFIGTVMQMPASECKKKWKNLRDHYKKKKEKENETKKSGSGYVPIKRWVHMDAIDAFMNGTLRHKRSVKDEVSCVSCPQYYYVGWASGNIEPMSNRDEKPECHDESIRLDDSDLTDQGAFLEIVVPQEEQVEFLNESISSEPSKQHSAHAKRRRRNASSDSAAALESLVSLFERSTESITAMISTAKDEYQAWADFAAATLRKLDAGTARKLMSQATVMFLTPDIAPKQS